MKLFIASDIHGSAFYCRQMLEAYDREKADRMLLLGDILYHGPRNDLPREYAPKEVIGMLNERRDDILCVRGNCDTEVDQMVLEFPILADYAFLCVDGYTIYATHGHVYNAAHACGGYPAARPYPRAHLAGSGVQSRLHLHSQGEQRAQLYDAEGRRVPLEDPGGRGLSHLVGGPDRPHDFPHRALIIAFSLKYRLESAPGQHLLRGQVFL